LKQSYSKQSEKNPQLNDDNALSGSCSKSRTDIRLVRRCLHSKIGKVFLVGAGPGDPELLTVKAYRILKSADVVLYDSLISDDVLSIIPTQAERIYVGKRANQASISQQKINLLLVEKASQGDKVIRLKGGDPFIFGRGAEELQALVAWSIPFEVVPGITAATGCAAYAGIPLTHRDYAQSVRFVTGRQKGASRDQWKELSRANQTIVFYMGIYSHQEISSSLISNGLSQNTPVAVVENGTQANQRVFIGIISQLKFLVEKNKIKTPGLIIVGRVVLLANKLGWFCSGQKDQMGVVDPSTLAKQKVFA
jgi:uroporphyrin-III C-methyltransferase